MRGNCYHTSEAVYHLLGGKKAGWKPMVMKHEGGSHWFLKHESGMIVDLTVRQFKKKPNYKKAKGCGFLTKKPSWRAEDVMTVLIWGASYL